jgi:hypothetical protein
MPLFFFHTQTDSRFTDTEGVECINSAEARRAAIQTCGEMMRGWAETFWGTRPWSVVVTDASGLILWEIYMDGVSSAAAPA